MKEWQLEKGKSMLIKLIIFLVAVFLAIYVIPKYLLQRTIVIGESMEPTVKSGENLWVEKLSVHLDTIKRFDIVVFYPYHNEKEYYIKRVIGLPGETIQIIDGTIYIDSKPLSESYGKEPIYDPGIACKPVVLEENEYFVLGDNRSVSLDSRNASVGPVKKESITGKAFFRLWPLSKAGFID